MIPPAVKVEIDRELFCKCGQCEAALHDILRMELMLCTGAKTQLGKRRKRIQSELRKPYFRERYAAQVLHGSTVTTGSQ